MNWPKPAERVAEDRGDRRQADGRHASRGGCRPIDQRDGERQLDPQQPLRAACSPSPRRPRGRPAGPTVKPATMFRKRISRVYVVSGMIAVSSDRPEIGPQQRERGQARDRVQDAGDRGDRRRRPAAGGRPRSPGRARSRNPSASGDDRQLEVLDRSATPMSSRWPRDPAEVDRSGCHRRQALDSARTARSASASSAAPSADASARSGRERRRMVALAHLVGDRVDGEQALDRAGPVDDDARLDVGVEHHRQRVLERRPLVERSARPGWPSLGVERPARRRCRRVGDPAERPVAVVDEQQVAERIARPGARASAASSPGRADRAAASSRSRDPQERQPLEAAVRADEPGHELRCRVRPGSRPAARTGRACRRPA